MFFVINTVQLRVRIPCNLNQRLSIYMTKISMSKTEVVLNALAFYLDCTKEMPLAARMTSLEEKLATL